MDESKECVVDVSMALLEMTKAAPVHIIQEYHARAIE